jgi:hypothetical protein
MVGNIGSLIPLLLVAACGTQDLTSSIPKGDPDLTGHYRSTFGMSVSDDPYGVASPMYRRDLLVVACPSEWILSRTKAREYTVTISLSPELCDETLGHRLDYLLLAPALTGLLRLDSVAWNGTVVESKGTIVIGTGTAQAFQDLTGCTSSGLEAGWNMAFLANTRRDYTFESGWSSSSEPFSTAALRRVGYFLAECRGIRDLFLRFGFNDLKTAN